VEQKAYDKAKRFASFACTSVTLDTHSCSKDSVSFNTVPLHGESPTPTLSMLIYYCENETIDGVPFSPDPAA
jgi:phosphoserine aminotransferase